jgi:hypothetical protein
MGKEKMDTGRRKWTQEGESGQTIRRRWLHRREKMDTQEGKDVYTGERRWIHRKKKVDTDERR